MNAKKARFQFCFLLLLNIKFKNSNKHSKSKSDIFRSTSVAPIKKPLENVETQLCCLITFRINMRFGSNSEIVWRAIQIHTAIEAMFDKHVWMRLRSNQHWNSCWLCGEIQAHRMLASLSMVWMQCMYTQMEKISKQMRVYAPLTHRAQQNEQQ